MHSTPRVSNTLQPKTPEPDTLSPTRCLSQGPSGFLLDEVNRSAWGYDWEITKRALSCVSCAILSAAQAQNVAVRGAYASAFGFLQASYLKANVFCLAEALSSVVWALAKWPVAECFR